MSNEIAKRELPELNALYDNLDIAVQNTKLNILLNQPPKADWVRENPMANNTKYIPIEKIEYLLTSIFLRWRVEIKTVMVVANSVVVTVRLHLQDPITGEWDWQEGVGAAPIQTDKGASATDFTKVKSSSVQMAAPAAESYAIKDAAEKLGKLFGKDLNRKDVIDIVAPLVKKAEILAGKLEKLAQ